MNKISKMVFGLTMISLLLTGCNVSKEKDTLSNEHTHAQIDKAEELDKNKDFREITTNSISLNSDELIKIIETTTKEEISMSKEKRYELREELYSPFSYETISELKSKVSNAYIPLTEILVDDRYKELLDKNNKRWDAYDKNSLFGISDSLNYPTNILKNQALKNDLNRVKELCSYGLENRDVIALIDARRILRDISFHLFDVPYFKENDEVVEIYEEDYIIYYGASEVLEGDKYKTIGLYK